MAKARQEDRSQLPPAALRQRQDREERDLEGQGEAGLQPPPQRQAQQPLPPLSRQQTAGEERLPKAHKFKPPPRL